MNGFLGDGLHKMTKLDKSYKEQDCCANCKFVFLKQEYEEPNPYFCHVDNSKRPLCGSVFMGEFGDTYEESCKIWDKWEEWADPREVKAYGICRKYQRR